MLNITEQVFSEVYDIIYNMKIDNYIPKEFVELINNNRDKQYKVNIDYSKSINDQELQRGTRVIVSLIYRDFLCNKEERQFLVNKDKEKIKKYEEELREKYNTDNLFKNRNNTTNHKKEEMQMIKIEKMNLFEKILKKIKMFFKIIK